MKTITMSRSTKSLLVAVTCALAATGALHAQDRPGITGSDPQHKVRLDFNRWHDTQELYDDLRRLERAYPKFLRMTSIGKSHGGRDLMVMTINNPSTGPEMSGASGRFPTDACSHPESRCGSGAEGPAGPQPPRTQCQARSAQLRQPLPTLQIIVYAGLNTLPTS